MADQNEMLRVGVISSTHGIKGEVKVYPTTDDASRYKQLKRVWLATPEGDLIKELELEGIRFFKQMVIVKFKGYDNINDIEKYRGYDLLITREEAVPLAENEYFICDVVGSKVVTAEGVTIGVVEEILTTGANDVYQIRLLEGVNELPAELRGGRRIEAGEELLLPSIPECILKVDIKQKIVTVAVMKGSLG
ncbi:MAG: 16S rRNA processing protein RimM [Lachnospiraceae bacterium]|jgi:16S rRNA processing protein RimM|nr:16S rRNA processing protein RimM [Lachnospiraceae bacterium]MCX4315503.1 ribosome maturation factor RimM [Lachnospiraceae bacterium]